MLWRESYVPDVRKNVLLPAECDAEALVIGAFSLAALREVELWVRLAREANVPFTESYWLIPEEKAALSSLLAPSRFQAASVRDDREAWLAALHPIDPSRSFAAISKSNSPMVIVGPSTEDAWEEMTRLLVS